MWLQSSCFPFCIRKFLLTHPVWDVTRDWSSLELQHSISTHTSRVGCDGYCFYRRNELGISTHTSRVGCDTNRSRPNTNKRDFYSHIPCGMWPRMSAMSSFILPFLLTHPVWDVTPPGSHLGLPDTYFYSHIPCGMWHHSYISYLSIQSISTHTSRVGCDFSAPSSTPTITYFYSHIPCGMWQRRGNRSAVYY